MSLDFVEVQTHFVLNPPLFCSIACRVGPVINYFTALTARSQKRLNLMPNTAERSVQQHFSQLHNVVKLSTRNWCIFFLHKLTVNVIH